MKTYIWSLPTRLFHWLLAISFTITFLLGGEEEFIGFHAALGVMIGGLIVFRLIQGVVGPRYARFADFPLSPNSVFTFLRSMRESKAVHPGHNPLASWVMLFIMLAALFSALSGIMIFAAREGGFLGLQIGQTFDSESIEEFHEIVVHLFLILVGFHLTGILADTIFHRENGTIFSIFTGYKSIKAIPVELSLFQKIYAFIWLTIPFLLFLFVLQSEPSSSQGADRERQGVENKETEDDD